MANSLDFGVEMFGMEILYQLRARLAAAGRVNSRYSSEIASAGDTINVPFFAPVGAANTRANQAAITTDDLTGGNRTITLDHIYKSVKLDNLEYTLAKADLRERAAVEIAYSVAKKVDSLVLGLWNKIPYECGEVDGTAAFNATDKNLHLSSALQILESNGARTEGLVGWFNPREAHAFRSLDINQQVNTSGSDAVRRTGVMGNVFGIDLISTQQVASATLTTDAIWDAPCAVDTNAAIGATSIHVDGLGAGSIAAGSTFSLNGERYSVTTTTSIVGNEVAALPIYPALRTAAVDGDVLTPTGHSAAGSMNIVADPGAIGLATRLPAPFAGNIRQQVLSDPETGLSMLMVIESFGSGAAGTAMHDFLGMHILAGTNLLVPEGAVKVTGIV